MVDGPGFDLSSVCRVWIKVIGLKKKKKKKAVVWNQGLQGLYDKQTTSMAVTVLRELGGAHQSGDLEGVLADGAVGQVLDALPGGRVALLLQLQLCGRQVQVQRQILQFLRLCLVSNVWRSSLF